MVIFNISGPICFRTLSKLSSLYFILSVSFSLFFSLKYRNSFKNSSSHTMFAEAFFNRLLRLSLGWHGTASKYFSSGSYFNLFLHFKCSQGWSGTFLINSISLLCFLLLCTNSFLFRNICKYFLSGHLSLSLGCKGVCFKFLYQY